MKEKISKDEKNRIKLNKKIEKMKKLLGEDEFNIMFKSLIVSGYKQGKITEPEYKELMKTYFNEEGDHIENE